MPPRSTGNKPLTGGHSGDINDKSWIDRIAVELKAQREWARKWQVLADPKLYISELSPSKPQTSKPTKWSAFSVINPPGKSPTEDRLVTPPGFIEPTYKITGTRDHYLAPQQRPQRVNAISSKVAFEVKGSSMNRSSFQEYYGQHRPDYDPEPIKSGGAKNKTYNNRHSKLDSTKYHTPSYAKSSIAPAFHNAPFATATPVSQEALSKMPKHERASLKYSTNLVGARSGTRSQFAEDPASIYRHPGTSSMEYGWTWNGRKTLETYGSTSADFTKGSLNKARA